MKMKRTRRTAGLALAFLSTLAVFHAATTHAASHTWSGAVNGNFSNAGNWSSGGAPTLGETNILIFPAGATRTTITNDVGALKISSANFSGGNYVVRGAHTLTFTPALVSILTGVGTSNTVESSLSFQGLAYVSVNSGAALVLSGALSGSSGLLKANPGTLYFRGAASNPLSGDLTISSGELHFQKTGGAAPYSGNSILVGSANEADFTQFHLHADDQIPDGADLEIQPSGKLFMNNFSDKLNSVTMYAGGLDTGTGTLGMYGNLNLTPSFDGFTWGSPAVLGRLEFHGTACTLSVSTNVCDIDADIVENATPTAINKTGAGSLRLRGGGNFTGQFNILAGSVHASTVNSLGSISGSTTVSNGASLIYAAGVTTSESLVLSGAGDQGRGALQLANAGTTTTFGNITVSNLVRVAVTNGGLLVLNGVVSGPGGLEKVGDGELSLTGIYSNTFAGASFVSKGKLTLNKNANVRAIGSVTVTNGASLVFNNHEQMDNAGVLSIHTGATVDLLNRNETIGGLNIGSNVVNTGTGLLTLQGNLYAGPPYATNAYGNQATFLGNLSLGGATRLWQATNSSLVFDCSISDGAGVGGFIHESPDASSLWLLRSNSFTGPASITGPCNISNTFAFGAPSGGVFFMNTNNYAMPLRFLQPLAISGETLTVGARFFWVNPSDGGSNAWHGPVVTLTNSTFELAGGTNTLTVTGEISGPGKVNVYSGLLRLTASNTYSGIATIESPGTLAIQHPNALGATTEGTRIEEGGTLLLELPNGGVVTNESLHFWYGSGLTSNTVDWLAVAGPVTNTWCGPVTVDYAPTRVSARDVNGALVFDAAITGDGGLCAAGPGRVILTGTNANTYTGETTVTDGRLFLNKPNGVQATSDLLILSSFGYASWLGSEQIADGARLVIQDSHLVNLGTNDETITHLALVDASFGSAGGKLTLLGDVDLTDNGFDNQSAIYAPLRLSAGSHLISTTNPVVPATLFLDGHVTDLTTDGGLILSNVSVTISTSTSNTFSGPVNLVASTMRLFNRYALGSPAQGVTMDQLSALYLDLPHGQAISGESLTVVYNFGLPDGASILGSEAGYLATNGWSGPITLGYFLAEGVLHLVGPEKWGLELSGPITGPGFLFSRLTDTLFLTGANTNNFGWFNVLKGQARLAKSPGVPATGPVIYVAPLPGFTPEIHLDAAGQLPAETHLSLGGGSLYLHDHPTRLRVLLATNAYSYINCGANPATTLTISNYAPYADSEFFGDFNGTLVKQGAGAASFSGYFQNGDLFVQGGTFNRTALGVAGQTVISPGAVVNSSGPNIFNFGALSGSGTLNIAGNNTWVGGSGGGSTFTGAIIGTNNGALLTKLGSGALTLAGPVSLISTTLVQNGTLLVNTTMTNPVIVTPLAPGNQPTLGGTGLVGNVTVSGLNSRIAPGATTNVPSYGRLRLANLTLGNGGGYQCEIGGTNAGVDLDQIDASGSVTLSGGFANFSAFGAGATSNRYAVVKSAAPVSGTFLGDPEGDYIYPAAGRFMVITYLTAGGKEVTLIEQAGAPVGNFGMTGITQLTNGHISLVGTGAPSAAYFIFASTNLGTTNWISIGSALGDWNGDIRFTDTNAPVFPQRFYRFQLQ